MSWNFSVTAPKEEAVDAVKAEAEKYWEGWTDSEFKTVSKEQSEQALGVVASLIGAVGPNAHDVHVSLSGHENPDRDRNQGMANGVVNVLVSVVRYDSEVEDEPAEG